MQVNILEAKNRLSELIKSAQAGEEVVIANRGQPVARLVAAEPPAAATGQCILAWLDRTPLPEHARRTHDQIEEALREERAAWD